MILGLVLSVEGLGGGGGGQLVRCSPRLWLPLELEGIMIDVDRINTTRVVHEDILNSMQRVETRSLCPRFASSLHIEQ